MLVAGELPILPKLRPVLDHAPGIEVAATVTAAAAGEVERLAPDVVLLGMPEAGGFAVVRRLRALPRPPVVAVLAAAGARQCVMAALCSGASGFLFEDTDPVLLVQYVRTLACGAVVLAPEVTASLVPGCAGRGIAARLARLTGRERQVLRLVAEGLSNVDIAARMHLSTGTVKDHLSAVFVKLDVHSRVRAALLAQKARL